MRLKLVHQHRLAGVVRRRISELVFIRGRPQAILGWVDLGGMRTPLYLAPLDPGRLHRTDTADTWTYDGTTNDPADDLLSRGAEAGP